MRALIAREWTGTRVMLAGNDDAAGGGSHVARLYDPRLVLDYIRRAMAPRQWR